MDSLSNRFAESKVYVKECKGAWITDQNSKKYIDYLLGNCCHILGHSHPRIIEAIRKQSEKCINVGDHHFQSAYDLAENIKEISSKDAIRLVNSGSEAVHLAIRLARGYTSRNIIVKFWGHYHGWFMEEISHFVPEIPYKKGLVNDYSTKIVAVEWNNLEQVDAVFAEYGDEIAAVICEPVLCHAGPIPPEEGFLEYLREKTNSNHSLLIFDECITGLRIAFGGAQEYFGVNADIVTYSKAFSGGIPIGICAGTKEVMQLLGDGHLYQAATYDANPMSSVVANEVISIIKEEKIYDHINDIGNQLINGIDEILNRYSISHIWQGFPSVFQFYYTDKDKIRNSREALTFNNLEIFSSLVEQLLENGVSLVKGDLRENPNSSWLSQWFVSNAHGKVEVDYTLDAYEKSLKYILGRK